MVRGDWRRQRRPWLAASLFGILACIAAVLVQVPVPPAGADPLPFSAPATGRIVSVYGDCRDGCSRLHQGYDIEDAIGAPVYAAASGTIESVVRSRSCPSIASSAGNQAAVVHPGGVYRTVYLHLETVLVNNGQHVVRGQQIGTMGNVGSLACLEPPHLHFEVRRSGIALNLNDILPLGALLTAGNPIPRRFDLPPAADIEVDDSSVNLNADGRLGAVTRATGGAIWYASQAAPGSLSWTGWQSLGGIGTSDPYLAQNLDGRLQVFALGLDHALWSTYQVTPAGGWSGWTPIATAPTSFIGDPVAVRRLDGRLDVFVRSWTGGVWQTTQLAAGSSGWSPWHHLGGIATSDVSAAVHGGGGLEVFARGADGALWNNWQLWDGSWSGWGFLGGFLNGGPAIGTNLDGRLEVFARGGNNALYHRYQVAAPGGWTGWQELGGVLRSDPDVVRNADGRLEVLAVGTDFSVWHTWQTTSGGPLWSGWAFIGGRVGSAIASRTSADGRVQIVVRADGSLGIGTFSAVQSTPGSSTWFGWGRL